MKGIIEKLLLGTTIAVLPMTLLAQEKEAKQEKIRIRVEKNIDGKKEIQEKTIDATGMNQAQKEVLIEKLQDSLANNAGDKKMKQMKVTIEDEGDMMPNEDHIVIRRSPRESNKYRNYDDNRNFEYHIERFGDRMREFGEDLPRRLDFRGPVYTWDDQLMSENGNIPPIRNVEVFPNKPEIDILNIRFVAKDKGDVSIKILDINGKIVEQKDIKDFSGEYVGQLALKKGSKGTFFIIISQNNDGISQRIVLDEQANR